MLSVTESNSVQRAVEELTQALYSLLARHRAGNCVQLEVVGLSEALEKLEDLIPTEEDPIPTEIRNCG